MKNFKLYNFLFLKNIRINTSFESIRETLLNYSGNNFDKISVTSQSILFDYTNTGSFSTVSPFQMYSFSSYKSEEIDGKALIRFNQKKGYLIFFILIITFILNIPFWQITHTLWYFPFVLFMSCLLATVLLKFSFMLACDKFTEDLQKLFDNAPIFFEK